MFWRWLFIHPGGQFFGQAPLMNLPPQGMPRQVLVQGGVVFQIPNRLRIHAPIIKEPTPPDQKAIYDLERLYSPIPQCSDSRRLDTVQINPNRFGSTHLLKVKDPDKAFFVAQDLARVAGIHVREMTEQNPTL